MTNQESKQNNNQKKFRYHGNSMFPTFKPGQVLYLRPEGRSPKPGDIVVFQSQGRHVVHRVERIVDAEYITRGDNNSREDMNPILLDQIIGIVEEKDEWGKIQPVSGDKAGLYKARFRWKLLRLNNGLRRYYGAPYRWLKASRLITHIWHPQVTMVQMKTSSSDVVKYVVRGKTVATWYQEERRFQYKWPYDLVIFPPEKTM